jgi:hypothetical protein
MTSQSGKGPSAWLEINPKGDQLGKYGSVMEAVQDNLLAFLLGWLVGAGLAPMLVEQIAQAL